MSSTPAASSLSMLIPAIDEVVRFFQFRIHAVADGGATNFTPNIKIRMVNCFYTILSLPAVATPQRFVARDVTDATPMYFLFAPVNSDHWECVTITERQSTVLAYPGTPDTRISAVA